MQSSGLIFRQLRQARHLTLQQVADSRCSVAMISKFERGERQITSTRLMHLLAQINVAPDEYLQAVVAAPRVHATMPELEGLAALPVPYAPLLVELTNQVSLLTKIGHQVTNAECLALSRMGEAQLQADGGETRWQRFLRIIRAVGVAIVRNNQATPGLDEATPFARLATIAHPVTAYLFTVEAWGLFELALLRALAESIDAVSLYRLMKLAVARCTTPAAVPQIRELLMVCLQGGLSKFINTGHFDWAAKTLLWRKQYTPPNGVRWALETTFLSGWLRLAQGDPKGEQDCQAVVAMLTTLQLPALADTWRQRLEAIQRSLAAPGEWSIYL